MANYTPKNAKFNRAIEYCMSHPELTKANPRWKQYGWNRLYLLLADAGVTWNIKTKCWQPNRVSDSRKSNPVRIASKEDVFKRLILIRIIAHPDHIAGDVENVKLLADVIGLNLIECTKPIWNNGGRSQRVYMKFSRGGDNG